MPSQNPQPPWKEGGTHQVQMEKEEPPNSPKRLPQVSSQAREK
jgi:hypothetical protein